MTLMVALKTYVVIEIMQHHSPVNSAKGRFIGALRGIDYSGFFMVKAWIQAYPVLSLMIALSYFIILNSYLLYISET